MLRETIDVTTLEGKPVHAAEGGKVGDVAAVLLDKETARPEWLAVKRGFGKQVLVPVAEADVAGDVITVPYSEAVIDSAPEGQGDEVSQETERVLASHYGLVYSKERSSTGLAEGRDQAPRSRTNRSGRSRRTSGDGPTRAELYDEAKRLGIEGRSRMKKSELARAVERAGGKSGGGTKANPVEVQKFLDGVGYPTRKADLVREAKRQGADASVRSTLERIRDEKFDSPADVSEAIGRLS
jgi:sporulation protein YlmC with PRC-barrel domain